MLNLIRHGAPGPEPKLLIVHGLFGSARNWGVIAKRLSQEREVIAVDMRNHGASPWYDSHSYHDLAGDLAEVITAQGGRMDVLGHSMGGKAAMVLALTRPELVNRLLLADIAPVSYEHSQMGYLKAMQAVDLEQVSKRSDAEAQLLPMVENATLASFFTQSLDLAGKRWRLNLETLEREMEGIIGFPEVEGQFDGPCLVLAGALSSYILPEHRPRFKELFPKARFIKIPGAGHWIHAEKPRGFEAAIRAWLDKASRD